MAKTSTLESETKTQLGNYWLVPPTLCMLFIFDMWMTTSTHFEALAFKGSTITRICDDDLGQIFKR